MSKVKPKILVVDDEIWGRDPLVQILNFKGEYNAKAVESGEKALHVIQNEKVDLVLMDVSMPGMSGLKAIEYIRKMPLHTTLPIFIVSGLTQKNDIQAGLKAGADDYLTKPINIKILRGKINRALV